MILSRRSLTGGALSLAAASQFAAPAFAQGDNRLATAFAAIRRFGEMDLAFNNLPGMTLGTVMPNGTRTVMNFGYADPATRHPITADTLFQVGSITKLMVAAMLHQFAAEGRLRLSDRISSILPQIPLPPENQIEIQHLLDHVAGIAADPPIFSPGGLWTAYNPGAHWHYSNTGYDILGKLAERIGGKPLDQLLRERIFTPLGMTRSHGAILSADKGQYAQGYAAADQLAPYVRGAVLTPAPWVDVTDASMCVASTADDMMALLGSLAAAAQGKGGLGLSPQTARAFVSHVVPSDIRGMTYGNGLMHFGDAGRAYLHHTGGMLSFSSSFHVNVGSGVGAFASTPLSAFAEYRPRLLTQFAVDALTDALSGRMSAPPPQLDPPLANAESYVGRYSGPTGAFEIKQGSPLTIVAGGQSAPLMLWSDEIFRTRHPLFRNFSLMFERTGGAVATASWGPNSYAREGSGALLPQSDPALARLAGTYASGDPWFGPVAVVERGGKLWLGTEMPMTRISDNLWRVGRDSWSPERASFADFVGGRPRTFIYSAIKFTRRD